MKDYKLYRVYFNRKGEWPQIWSIDEGNQSSEINVKQVHLLVPVVTCSLDISEKPNVNPNDTPFAWMECEGYLAIDGGEAYILPQLGDDDV